MFNKVLIIIFCLLVAGCDGGGSDNDINKDSAAYDDVNIFPYTDTKDFGAPYVGDLINSNNGLMWIIKGSDGWSSGMYGIHDYTIYSGTDSLDDPSYQGIKTDYFMLMDGVRYTFFVEPISYESIILTDTKDFGAPYVGDLINSNDGSIWILKGSDGWSSGMYGIHDYTIYSGTNSLDDPSYQGIKTDYFMLMDGVRYTFFVEPL